MKNKIEDVRNHLVEAIERVMAINDASASPEDKMTLEQAEVVSKLADSYTNLVKAEFTGIRIMVDAASDAKIMQYAKYNPLGLEYRNEPK